VYTSTLRLFEFCTRLAKTVTCCHMISGASRVEIVFVTAVFVGMA